MMNKLIPRISGYEITQGPMLKPMCTNIVNLWALSGLYSSLPSAHTSYQRGALCILSALKRYSITLVSPEHSFKHLAIQWKFGSKFLE